MMKYKILRKSLEHQEYKVIKMEKKVEIAGTGLAEIRGKIQPKVEYDRRRMQDWVPDMRRICTGLGAGYAEDICRICAGYMPDMRRIGCGMNAEYARDMRRIGCRICAGYAQYI